MASPPAPRVDNKPLALVITRNLPPMVGGMERLIGHIVDSLRASYQVAVVGPCGCREHLPDDVTVAEVPPGPLSAFLANAFVASLRLARNRRPSLVLAGSGLTAPIALLAAKACGARSAVYLHGLDVEANHWAYRAIWRRSFRHFDLVIANSLFTRDLAISAGVPEEKTAILNPGTALPSLEDRDERRHRFRQRHSLGDAPVMLYVGRITPRKGLSVFVRHILPSVVAKVPGTRFVVVGDEPGEALLKSARGELAAAQEALNENGLAATTLFLGELGQDDPALSDAYFAADVHIFPVQDRPGDNEGFGMVAIEAAAHGLPTVAFSAGGVPDAVADGQSGVLIPAGDNHAFASATIAILHSESKSPNPRRFAEKFAWPHFASKLDDLIGPKNGPRQQHASEPTLGVDRNR